MKKALLALCLALLAGCAEAQTVTCATRPASDSSNACANTAFVSSAIAAVPVRSLQLNNDGTTGTVLNQLAAVTTAGNAIRQSISATDGTIGIVSSGAGTVGTVTITTSGSQNCVFDGATTAGDFVVASATAGQCHDAGNSRPNGNQTIGQVLSTNAAAGTYPVNVIPNGAAGSGGGSTTAFTNDFCATTTTGCGTFTPGTTSSLVLSATPTGAASVAVYFDGVNQSSNTWILSGTTITFNAAIPINVQVVEVKWTTAGAGGTVTQINSGTGLTGGPIVGTGTLSLANTAVTAGTYTAPNITVNAQGQITSATNGTSIIQNYSPVGGDNGSAFQSALNTAASANAILQLPCNITFQITGVINVPSNAWIRGCGPNSVIQKTPSSGATTFFTNSGTAITPTTNVHFENFTFDGQGATIASAFYVNVFSFMNGLWVDRMNYINPNGTLFYLYENDTNGSGPSGRPLQPDGQQYSFNINITNSSFNCSGGNSTNSDCADFLRISGLYFVNNTIQNGQANCFGFQFNTNFLIAGNVASSCWHGFYFETCYNGTIRDNDWYGLGTRSSLTGDNPTIGIWLADANQTYSGGGYNGSHEVIIAGNHLHDVQRTSGTTGEYGVYLVGPTSSLPGRNQQAISNTCYNLNLAGGSGPAACIAFGGYEINPIGAFNQASFTTTTIITGSSYTTSGYAASNTTTGTFTFTGNAP